MKRTSLAACLMGLVLGATACSHTPEEPSSGAPAPAEDHHASHHADSPDPLVPVMLSFAPGDLGSDVGATPITVFAEQGGQPVDEAVLEKIADQIELRTYPEMEPVDAEIAIVPSAPTGRILQPRPDQKGTVRAPEPSRERAGRASLVVRPSRPLADRWYVVSLAELPAGTRPVAWTGVTDTPMGAFAARFHPGSQPVLRDVRLCEKDQGRAARVVARFSEGLRVDAATAARLVRVRDARTGEACTVVGLVAPDVPQTMLEIDCPASVLEGRTIDLGLSAGLASTRGAPLSSIEGRGRAIEIDDTIDFSETDELAGCRTVPMQ